MADVEPPKGRIDLSQAADFQLASAMIRPSLLQIESGGSTQQIEARVMQMLVALHNAEGGTVTKEQLINDCWGGLAISDDAITQCVSKLRRSLAVAPSAQVLSVPRVGYRLVERASERHRSHHKGRQVLAAVSRIAATSAIVAGTSLLGFDSRSVAIATRLEGQAGTDAAGPQRLEAERLHLAAVGLFRERSRDGYTEAEKLLRRSIAIDPSYAPNWARLSMVVYAPAWWASEDDPDARARLRSQAIGYARHGLALEPNLAEGHQAMGFVLWNGKGLTWLERAAVLDPNDGEIRQQLADLLEERLELRRALVEAQRAVELEPTIPRAYATAAHLLDRLGHRAEADALLDRFERETHRSNEARIDRFGLRFAKGELAEAAGLAAQSLELGDENRWWAQSCLLDVANALHDGDLRRQMLRLQPKLTDTITYESADYSLRFARTRPNDWWQDLFVGGLARQLVATGNDALLLSIYDDHYDDVETFWNAEGERADFLAPPLILAMRRSGRAEEAAELRNRFAADIDKLTTEGDRYLRPSTWRAELAALDDQPDIAARWLDVAIAAGWKGQAPYRMGFAPDQDPVFALVRNDPQMQRSIARFQSAVAAEGVAVKRLRLTERPWARKE